LTIKKTYDLFFISSNARRGWFVAGKILIVATRNRGKVKEIKDLLGEIPLKVLSLNQLKNEIPEIQEDQPTFAGNAIKKAETVSELTGEAVLADDSGLEVDALGGEPGVYSARYAGEKATDAENNAKLLEKMEGIPENRRTARFRCVIALAVPQRNTLTLEGFCEGIITREPGGEEGFGYDPIFYYPPLNATLAELSPSEKNRISHRGKALCKAVPLIREILIDLPS